MKGKHVAFCLEQAYGHIIPTLGITLELIRRGHRVTYAVTKDFASAIKKCGARPVVFDPLDTRSEFLSGILRERDHINYSVTDFKRKQLHEALSARRTTNSLLQLEQAYRTDVPDLFIHDENMDSAGRALASRLGRPKVRHFPQAIDDGIPIEWFADDELILVSAPSFFQKDVDLFDQRFKFIGFIPEGRHKIFDAWSNSNQAANTILISVTTGLLPQVDFCKLMLETFRDQPWTIILSISGAYDPISAISVDELNDLPRNVQLNLRSSNLDILRRASLFIGQGGQGSILEALYCGVPVILIPQTPFHNKVAQRVVELQLGRNLPLSELTKGNLLECVISALNDRSLVQRVEAVQNLMKHQHGAGLAVDLLETYMLRNQVN